MAAKPSDAKTTIDSLAELLKERGKMEIGKIASTLGVDQRIVENWAKVLEEGNLVKITNEVGRMYVEPITITREQEQNVTATIDAQRSKLENDVAMQKVALDRYAAKLDTLGLSVKSAESMFRQKFPELENQLAGINKIYTALEEENGRIDTIRKNADTIYEDINKKIALLYGKVEGVDSNTDSSAKDELQKIHEILKKAGELENQLVLLSKSKDKALDTIKKSIEDQLKSLEKELTKAQKNIEIQIKADEQEIQRSLKAIKDQARTVEKVAGQVNSFRREKETSKKSLNDAKDSFNDQYTRITERMDLTGASLRAQIESMLGELNTLKANFGEVDKVYSTMEKTRMEIESMQKKIAELKTQADLVSDKVKALETMKGSTDSKVRATQKAIADIKNLADQTKDIDNNMDKLEKGADEVT